jgi:hypothetical protein
MNIETNEVRKKKQRPQLENMCTPMYHLPANSTANILITADKILQYYGVGTG